MTIEDHLSTASEAIATADKIVAAAGTSANAQYRVAADHMAAAQEQGASQRKIQLAVGKSLGWVNRLLNWRKAGYKGSPFGPQSAASRVRQKNCSVTEQNKLDPTTTNRREENPVGSATKQADLEKAKATVRKFEAEAVQLAARAKKAEEEAAWAKAEAETWKAKANANASAHGRLLMGNGAVRLRDLLVKTLGMLGSNQDGESLNAARMAEEQRKKLNLNWDDLIVPAQISHARAA